MPITARGAPPAGEGLWAPRPGVPATREAWVSGSGAERVLVGSTRVLLSSAPLNLVS